MSLICQDIVSDCQTRSDLHIQKNYLDPRNVQIQHKGAHDKTHFLEEKGLHDRVFALELYLLSDSKPQVLEIEPS